MQLAGTPTFGNQKPEKPPQRRGALLRCRPPGHPAALQDKLTQAARIPSGRLLAESSERLADVDPVIGQRAVARTTLLLHPSTETDEQRRKRNHPTVRMANSGIAVRDVMQEQADT